MKMPSSTSSLTLLTVTASSLFTAVSTAGDWIPNWSGSERILESAFDVDPLDDRSMMRGSGQITLGNDIAIFKGSPRLYISQEAGSVEGWGDVEITGYGKYVDQGTAPFKSYSGLTMVTRSNHDNYKNDQCDAFGYYARVYQESGECAFQKEYAHSDVGTVYSNSNRVDCFVGGLPLNQWVGLKFKVITQPGTSNVDLELYLDENNDGIWQLKHSMTDSLGSWFCSSSKTVPAECSQNDGDTVVRPGNVSFLRSDGVDDTTEVHWRDVSIVNSLSPEPTTPPTKQPTKAPVKLTVNKYICNRNSKSDSEVCASGEEVTLFGTCQQQGDSCGGPKTCSIAECNNTAGPPTDTTPAPTPPTTAATCAAPACTCNCADYPGSSDCRGCGCSWKGGCS